MTAKEYLSRLEVLEEKVGHKKKELEDIQSCCEYFRGNQTDDKALRIVSLERDIESRIIAYMELKNKIIDEIHEMDYSLFIKILYRRYVRNEKNLIRLACDMGYSYKYIINKHGEALAEFGRIHPELNGF